MRARRVAVGNRGLGAMYVGPWQEYKLAKFRTETLDALEDVAQQFPELQDIFRRRAAQERERRQYSAISSQLRSNVPRTAPAASSRKASTSKKAPKKKK